jgi:hypothetical protein
LNTPDSFNPAKEPKAIKGNPTKINGHISVVIIPRKNLVIVTYADEKQKYACREAMYSLVFFDEVIKYKATGGPPTEKRAFAVPPSIPNVKPVINVGFIITFFLKKIKYKLRNTKKPPSAFFMILSVCPLQKIITSVIANALPIIIGSIVLTLMCLRSFIAMKKQITSDEMVESTKEKE